MTEDFWTASRTCLAATASRTPSAFSSAAASAALADCASKVYSVKAHGTTFNAEAPFACLAA